MAKGAEVLSMLIPSGGWVIRGDKYEDIEWLESEGISKEEFEAGFAQYDAWKAQQDAKRKALLDKLGITEEEAKLLLS